MNVMHVSTDVRRSVRVVRAAGERSPAWFGYDPFGNEIDACASTLAARLAYRYIGQACEVETALYDYGARRYDPQLARFVSPDPRHQTASPYVYCANDPVDHVDRDGRGFDSIQEVTVNGARYLRGFNGEQPATEDLPLEPPDAFVNYIADGRGGHAWQQFTSKYDLLSSYVHDLLPEHGQQHFTIPLFLADAPDVRAGLWRFFVAFLRKKIPLRQVGQAGASADDEAPMHEAPTVQLPSPAERSDDERKSQSGTEIASEFAAEDLPHDLPDALPDLVDPDPGATAPLRRKRVVGRKALRGAFAKLYRFEPYRTPHARALIDKLLLRTLGPPAYRQSRPPTHTVSGLQVEPET